MPLNWLQAAGALVFALLLVLIPASAYADTKPYFQTSNGDPFAGGWFDPNCNSNYQAPASYPPASNAAGKYEGAILGFADLGNRPGASSNLDAFATGVIEGPGPAGANYGFYTGGTAAGLNPPSWLSFSNDNKFGVSDFWGGVLQGSTTLNGSHCIPDYYQSNQSAITGSWTSGDFSSPGYFSWTGGNLTNTLDRTVPAGTNLVIFVNNGSNVYIDGNIKYGSSTMNNIPRFTLVVKGGDIFIDPGVTQLDGWYIAQPDDSTGNGGTIWTCHNGNSAKPDDNFERGNCLANRLTVNGAFTAKQIYLGRVNGNLGGASAENINYSPETVLGGPFFFKNAGSSSSNGGNSGAIQSLISLPPIF